MKKCEDSSSHNEAGGGGSAQGGTEHSHPDEPLLSISPPRLEDGFDRGDFIKRTSNSLIDSF